MDAILSGIIWNIVSSKIYDTARQGYKKLTDSAPARKAIAATASMYPQFEALQFALITWCDSPEFSEFVERTRTARLANIMDNDIVEAFVQISNFYSDDSNSDAQRILCTFLQEYLKAIYASDQGQAAHEMRDMVDHATTQAGIQVVSNQVATGQTEVMTELAEVKRMMRQLASSPSMVQDALPSPDLQEQSLQAKVDVARSLLLAGKPDTAQTVLCELEKEIVGRSVSANLRGRIKGNLGGCALLLEQTDQAVILFREALTYIPNDSRALTNAALAASIMKDMPETLRLASAARQVNPREPVAAALYLQALQLSGRLDEMEQMLRDEPWISEDATCTLTLAEIRFDADEYDTAETLLNTSISKDANNPVAYCFLAHVILLPIQRAIMQNPPLPWRLDETTANRLEQAEAALNSAIAQLERRETPAQLRMALLNRSNCRRWTGEVESAIADCDRVLQQNPRDSEALHCKAATLLKIDRYAEAIACYEQMPNVRQNFDAYSALAYSYLQTNQPAKTIELLGSNAEIVKADLWHVEVTSLLLECHHRLGHTDEINTIIQQLTEILPDDPDALSVIAEQRYRENNVDTAKLLLHQALDKSDGNTRERIVLRLAKLHYNQNEFAEAARYFSQVVDTTEDSPFLHQYLISLVNGKMYDQALTIAQALRGGGKPIPVVSEAEALVQERIQNPRAARDLWLGLSEVEPEEVRYVLRAAVLGMQMGEEDAARELIGGVLYERIKDDPELLMQAAELRQILQMPDALPLAYQARRIGDERPELHLAYVNLFLHREDADRPMLEPQEVGLDCAVHLKRANLTKVFLITKDTPINRQAGERYPADPLAQPLIGKRKGEQVALKQNELEEVIYEIADIQSKYMYAFQQTLADFSTWFPGYPAFHMVSVENNDFSKIFKMLDDRHKMLVHVMQQYREKHLPLASIAKMIGRTTFDAWAMQIAHREGRIFAGPGDAEDSNRQSALLTNTDAIVMDITSILTICYLEREAGIQQRFTSIYIAQTVLDEVRRWLREARERKPGGTVWRDGDQYFSHETHEGDNQREVVFLERVEKFAAICKVVSIPAILTVGAEAYARMADIIGDSATTSMLVAKERNLPLYADDWGLRQLAFSEWQVQGIWSQSVLWSMQEKSVLTMEQYLDATKQLVLANYVYVAVTAEGLMRCLKQNGMAPTAEAAKFFEVLRGPLCNDDSAANVAAWVIRMVWLEKVEATHSLAILDSCLVVLVAGRAGGVILNKFKKALHERFVLMPIQLHHILVNIDAWASRHVLN